MKSIFNNENALNKKIRIMASCVEYIAEKDQIHSSKDISKEDMNRWIKNGLISPYYVCLSSFAQKMIDDLKISFYSGHQVERSISLYYLLNNLNYTIL